MQEKIQQLTQKAVANKKISIGLLAGIIVLVGGLVTLNIPSKDSLALASATQIGTGVSDFEVAVAGATSTLDVSGVENSWPGELVSLSNVPVQPSRDGVLASWDVHIGQKVSRGQVLGRLSAPPAMPDTLAMLAEEEKMLAMARVNLDAKRAYAVERIRQLEELRTNTERSLGASRTILGENTDTPDKSGGANFSMVEARRQAIRAMLRESLATTYPMLSTNGTLSTQWNAITLKDAIGVQNSRLRNTFPEVFFSALNDINAPDKLPIASGLAYFDLAIKLADASLPDGGMLTEMELSKLKTMLHEDQEAFIMAVDKLRETELMSVDTEKMSFEQLRMIDNDIAMLRQDIAMAEGDVVAKEAAYKTVRGATLGSTEVIAPKSGTISSITKKVGEFVGPGMPVAVVTSSDGADYIVRFRIPSNIRKPEIGEMFHVARPGFSETMLRAKLIGVGNSLDETGSIMADALLLEPTDWPVGVALRVMSTDASDTLLIPVTSLWWDTKGDPNVWAVSDAGRVYAKKVSLGRTLGEKVEVYSGLTRGDRYVAKSILGIDEDMLVDDIQAPEQKSASSYEEAMRAMGHEM